MQEIRNIFKCSYYQNHSEFYSKIIMVSKDTAQEQGRWFNFLACLCSLVFKKTGGLPSAWGCFPLVVRVFQPIYSRNILTGMHRGTCNLIREIETCTRSSGEPEDRQGSALTNKGTVLPDPSKVQRAGPVVVIRVCHRLVITRQTHSDQAGQD